MVTLARRDLSVSRLASHISSVSLVSSSPSPCSVVADTEEIVHLFRFLFHQAFPSPPGRGHREATWGLATCSLIPVRPILQTAAQTGPFHFLFVDPLTPFFTIPYSHSKSMSLVFAQYKEKAVHVLGNSKSFYW